jgi:hypothetical protein
MAKQVGVKVIYFGVCVSGPGPDERDPTLSGRIRAVMDEDFKGEEPQTYDATQLQKIWNQLNDKDKASSNVGEFKRKVPTPDELKWSEHDPHICAPFLPPFINVIPQNNENVKLIVYESNKKTQNKEYIGPTISRPTKFDFQNYAPARAYTSKGTTVKTGPNIEDNPQSRNIFPYPDKIALNGRKNSDLIFGNSEVILRAGKEVPNPNENDSEFPVFNNQMAALQISHYPTKLSLEEAVINVENKEVAPIKYLVEYQINDLNPSDNLFAGYITLYEVTAEPNTPQNVPDSTTMGLTTPVESLANQKARVTLTFSSQALSATTTLINTFLSEVDCRAGTNLKPANYGPNWIKTAPEGDSILDIGSPTPNDEVLSLYPFYFRPTLQFQNQVSLVSASVPPLESALRKKNAEYLYNHIGLGAGVNGGKHFGLKMNRDQANPDVKTEDIEIKVPSFDKNLQQSIVAAIGDQILLYSHGTSIIDKPPSNPFTDNKNLPYNGSDNMGIDQETLITMREEETEPLVRGEQLVDLLTQIVLFLMTHTHKEPGTAPVESKLDMGQKILSLLLEKNFLNKNIRIN